MMKLSNRGKNMGCLLRKKGSSQRRKHPEKLLCMILPLALAGFTILADSGIGTVNAAMGEFGFIALNKKGDSGNQGDMAGLLSSVTIKDDKGAEVGKGGQLYVGEKYTIHLKFQEGGSQSSKQFQWAEDGTMTYQIPSTFEIVSGSSNVELKVTIDGRKVIIGHYSITTDGKLTLRLTEEGKQALKTADDIALNFDMQALAQATEGGDGGKVHFDGDGTDFNFEIVDQPRVEVDKQGKYTENGGKTGGKLEYTVTTKVKHGQASNLEILDELTPPESTAFSVNDVISGDIQVTVKRNGGGDPIVLEKDKDYELVEIPDADRTGKKTFKIKLKEDSKCSTLYEGDELDVTYNYGVQYIEGSTDVFWGNVANDVHVTGKGKVPASTDQSGKETPEIDIDEERGSNVEIIVMPPGDGIIFKTQEFSEADHELHYTLYTVVPKGGPWTPFYIQDDMVVEFGGEKYYLPEFKEGGRVSHLQVSTVAVEDGTFSSWSDSTGDQRRQSLEELKQKATPLRDRFKFDDFPNAPYDPEKPDVNKLPEGYKPENMDQWVYLYAENGKRMNIIFGFYGGKWGQYDGKWGHWNITEQDTLIITEYDLDMSNDNGKITLQKMGDGSKTLEKEASEVLLAGIRNNVNMRFDRYYPGYSVFFNNADRMNKTGAPNKSDNTITYTVTMNATDTTVNKYFRDVTADLREKSWKYNESMQAVFHDKLPYGWKYVEGSLTVTAEDKYGNKQTFSEINPNYPQINIVTDSTESGKGDEINAPLALFYNTNGTGNDNKNHESYNTFDENLAQLTFTYKLKATDEWLKAHLTGKESDSVMIDNHAEIRDKLHEQPHWTAEAHTPYLPQYLTKEAEQVGETYLLQFTLHINRGGIDLDPKKEYLLVNDASKNLEVDKYSIQVLDENGKALTQIEDTAIGDELQKDQWVLMPSTEDGKFQLKVPDSVDRTDSGYDRSLAVNEIRASGSGSVYSLKIEKIDSTDSSRKLSGAEFQFYLVLDETSDLTETEKLTVGGKEYSCYTEDDWVIKTGENGLFEIGKDKNWRQGPGNYYILVETEAPEGYEELKEPFLFYFGYKEEIDMDNYPGAVHVLPDGTLTVADPPIPYSLPETGGSGNSILYLWAGLVLALGCGMLLFSRKWPRKVR